MKRSALGLAVMCLCAAGCRTYQFSESDRYRAADLAPRSYRRVATMGLGNPLFHEALNVTLMQRGIDVVEREKIAPLVREQVMADQRFLELSDREKAFRLGKLLNADLILYGEALGSAQRYEYVPAWYTWIFPLPIYGAVFADGVAQRRTTEINKTGVVKDFGGFWFSLYSHRSAGATLRAVDTKTGEIVWVGYGIRASCDKVTSSNLDATTSFGSVIGLMGFLLDDFLGSSR